MSATRISKEKLNEDNSELATLLITKGQATTTKRGQQPKKTSGLLTGEEKKEYQKIL